jgi:hypothetical protein
MHARIAAHFLRWTQADAESRSLGLAEYRAAIVFGKLHAPYASRLAVGHARQRRMDGRRDAASPATFPASNGFRFSLHASKPLASGPA